MYIRLTVVIALFLMLGCGDKTHTEATDTISSKDISVWPPPQNVSEKAGQVILDRGIYISPAISSDNKISAHLKSFVDHLNLLGISSSDPQGLELSISSNLNSKSSDRTEGYKLDITGSGATLSFSDYNGLQYGLNTLSQILYSCRDQNVLPILEISDHPYIENRGIFLDVVSHWFPLEVLLPLIDQLAIARYNTLYLHISDDQAYRLQSKVFDKLND